MDSTGIFKLIEEVQSFRPEDVPRLLKALQQTYQSRSISEWFKTQDSESQTDFIQKAVHAYCHILTSTKLAKAFLKVLTGLPETCQSVIEREIKAVFESFVLKSSKEDAYLKAVCVMLDQSSTAKGACHDLICSIASVIKDRLLDVKGHEKTNKEDCDTVYYTLKTCILCLQLNPESIKSALKQTPDPVCPNARQELTLLWREIFISLVKLLLQSALNRDLLFLLGTAVAMTMNLLPSNDDVITAYVGVINMLTSDQSLVTMGGISIQKPKFCPIDGTLSLLSIIKGLLVSAPKRLLCLRVETQPLLLFVFPYIMSVCQGSTQYHYVAFQLLSLWFEKLGVIRSVIETPASMPTISEKDVDKDSDRKDQGSAIDFENQETKSLSEGHKSATILTVSSDRPISTPLMSKTCPILSSTLSCLWLNWDSPVEGVSDFGLNIFQCVMKIWSQQVCDGLSDHRELSLDLMTRVMSMGWYSKTRYRPMGVLLSHLNSGDVLIHHPNLKEELMRCMAVNDMAALATDVYTICLQKIMVELGCDSLLPSWTQTWINTLLLGLTSSHALQRLKTCTYWLPPTLKIITGSAEVLLERIGRQYDGGHTADKNKWLFAWISVFKSARDSLKFDLPAQHDKFVTKALTSCDESVRSEVFMLICGTHKRAEPVTSLELTWLKSFLPTNIRTDSAPFRQCLTSAIKKLIVRIRDSCLSALRTRKSADIILSSGIEFIDWLFKCLMQSLAPGGSYQRRQTALNMLEVVLESLIFRIGDCSKKGKVSENSENLLKFAQGQGMWNFFSSSNFFTLLACLEDGADEIQCQSYRILIEFFPWPTSITVSNRISDSDANQLSMSDLSFSLALADSSTICHLLLKALELISSTRGYENDSGKLIMSIILTKFVMVSKIEFDFDGSCFKTSSLRISMKKLDENDENEAVYFFTNSLLQMLKTSLAAVQKDVAKQFKVYSMHGITECVVRCTQEALKIYKENLGSDWIKLLENIVCLSQDIVLLMLDVLAGGKQLSECPSFADMGMALEELVSSDFEDQEEVATLSPDFQLLLSWCWINLKNSCSCLGEITSCCIQGSVCLIDPTIIKDIGKLFVKVLTTCRHRGAIEGCRGGFSKFCAALLSCKIEELFNVPKNILEEILQSLSANSLTASVSRRSAGLPIIVQTILSNEVRVHGREEVFLITTVEHLYDIASLTLPADPNQQKDLAQSHALNVLKAIFCEASLSSYLTPHLSKMTILVIEGFDSPSWAIRNAATQLISTLVTRIFGQKNIEQGSMTLEEFHSGFPQLHDFAYQRLQACLSSKTSINPSFYLILTLFSNLAMAPSHQHQSDVRKTLQQIMLSFSSSPLYHLRQLSAQAYASLCPLDQVDSTVKELLGRLSGAPRNLNTQHGYFLCVHQFVSSGFLSDAVCEDLIVFLTQNHYFDEKLKQCSFIAATVMIILRNVLNQLKEKLDVPTANELYAQMLSHLLFLSQTAPSVQLGNNYALTEALKTLTVLTSTCRPLHPHMVQFLCYLSTSNIEDIRDSVLLCLSDGEGSIFAEDQSVQRAVIKNLSQETSASVFTQSCQLLARLHLQIESSQQLDVSEINSEDVLRRLGSTNGVKSAAFLLDGMVIHRTNVLQLHSRLPLVCKCCQKLLEFSNPCVNEDLRLSAARFLRIAGKSILDYSKTHHDEVLVEEAVISIIKSLLSLLQDSESEVRQETASFINQLNECDAVHPDLAWEFLSKVISEKFWWSSNLISNLMEILFSGKELTSAIQCSMTSSREQRLFQPETESTMYESFTLKLWTFQTIKGLLSNEELKSTSFLTSTCLLAFTELNENLNCLVTSTEDKHFFNVTSHRGVFSALLGIILTDQLCVCSDANIGPEAQELHSLVEQLLHISNIHPILKNAVM